MVMCEWWADKWTVISVAMCVWVLLALLLRVMNDTNRRLCPFIDTHILWAVTGTATKRLSVFIPSRLPRSYDRMTDTVPGTE